MRKLLVFSSVIAMSVGCSQKRDVRILQGYIVYILPDKIRFVETKKRPDSNYIKNFSIENFTSAISFSPNCEIKRLIEKIKADTLFDENPEIKEFATFLKQPLIFPAKIIIADTTLKINDRSQKKFTIVMNKKRVEFNYCEFNSGVIINVTRLE